MVLGVLDQSPAEFALGLEAICPTVGDGFALGAPVENVPIRFVQQLWPSPPHNPESKSSVKSIRINAFVATIAAVSEKKRGE